MSTTFAFTPGGFELPLPVVVLGAIVGMTYGLLAVGLTLVYRSNRIINFAHGEIGAFAAAVFATAVLRWHLPYYVAAVLVFVVAAGVAALAEVAVVRRLRRAPRVMSVVATLGVGQFLVFFAAAFNPQSIQGYTFPVPPGLPEFDLGALRLTTAYVGMLVFGPVLIGGLSVFLRRSRYGRAIRASAENPEAARMAGVFAGRMSSLSWAIAGIVSAFTAILVLPTQGVSSGESFGPSLLLRALAAAAVARMTSLPGALAAGIGLGVVEQLLLWNYPRGGFVEVLLFAVILVALLTQRGARAREEEKGTWATIQAWRPLPEPIAQLREVRAAPWLLAIAGLGTALALPAFVSNADAVTLSTIMAFSIVGLSVGIVTGLGGQVSLGQFAVGAVGAVISYHVSRRVGAFPLAFLYAGLGGAAVSVMIGAPALRIKGLLLTVSSLGFALVTGSWLLQQPWALGNGVNPGRPILTGHALTSGKAYYYVVLALLVATLLLVHNVRRGGIGRRLVAVRDNEDNARAFTIPSRLVKLQGAALAGFVAGVGGAAYGHILPLIGPRAFPVSASIDVVAMAVIGGMALLVGPVIGALYIIGVPAFLPLDSAGLAATQLGWLLLVLYLPGGIGQGLEPVRARFVLWAARRHELGAAPDLEAAAGGAPATTTPSRASVAALARGSGARPARGVLLDARGLHKRYGGIAAVNDVSLQVRAGEIVGLIGPNGAGKTTTFELVSGFSRPDAGSVLFAGEDVTRLRPEHRAERGLIRSFQDAALFPTLTVRDVVKLAQERSDPTNLAASLVGLGGAERRKDRRADDLLGAMGLHPYRNSAIHELSTGTRRITEIACLVALEPRLLLLDEPSSGIAQRETEALGVLLEQLRRDLSLTMLVIEHDIPLIMGLADRIVAMDAGTVLITGAPEDVRTDPRVVEAYLGGSLDAIERSNTSITDRPPQAADRETV